MNKKRDKKNIRQVNTALVLNTLFHNDSRMSRPDLAEEVGLSKVTIASIIRNLNQAGLTMDAGMGLPDNRGGRKPLLVALDKGNKRIISVRIGPEQIEMLLSDITGREINRLRSNGRAATNPKETNAMARELTDKGNTKLDSVLGLMATFDHSKGLKRNGFDKKSYCLELSRLLNVRVSAVALPNARAFAQRWYNEEFESPTDFFYLDLDADLQAVTTKKGSLGDNLPGFSSCCLSHLPYGSKNTAAATAESLLSGEAFLERAAAINGRRLSFSEIMAKVRAGDDYSLELLQQYGYQLGYALSLAVNLTSLHRIIIGGFMAEAWPFFNPLMSQGLSRHVHPEFKEKVTVSPLRKDLNNGLMGALAIALDEWIYQTSILPQDWKQGEPEIAAAADFKARGWQH